MKLDSYHPFRSAQAKQAYLDYYDRRAESWPVDCEERLVTTSVGQTFVRISGAHHLPPLVLLPASVFNSLMWIPNIESLSQQYRTYAIDNIYDCGRSIYARTLTSPEDLIQWLDELFTVLDLGNDVNLMGLSYGSWLAHRYALQFPQRVRRLVLLAHPTVVAMNADFVIRLLFSFVSPQLFRSFVYWLFEDTARKDMESQSLVECIYTDMQLAGKCYKPKAMINPTSINDSELHELQTPTLFLVGENEKTFSPYKAKQRLNMVAPQIKTELIAQAGHDLNFAQSKLINKTVLEFLK